MICLHHLELVFNLMESALHGPILSLKKLDMLLQSTLPCSNEPVFLLFFFDGTAECDNLCFCSFHVFFVLLLKFNDLSNKQLVFVLKLRCLKFFLSKLLLQILYSLYY